ncbi:MAG: hypothetical protein ABJC62_02725 [Frankiaceae bacterium]
MSQPSVSWVALVQSGSPPRGARYSLATFTLDSRPAGWFLGWTNPGRPHPAALRIDPRLLSEAGPAMLMSLALPEANARPLIDDPAVLEARRASLRHRSPAARSTLSADPVHWAGTLTVARRGVPLEEAALDDDPWARLAPTQRLAVGAGIFTAVPAPVGPSIERYGGTHPWPYDRF